MALKKSETLAMLYREKKTAEEIAEIIGIYDSRVFALEAKGQKRIYKLKTHFIYRYIIFYF